MKNSRARFQIGGAVLIAVALGTTVIAQQFVTKAPTAADWAALAKLPDFNGVWERGGVGGGGNAAFGTAPAPAGQRGNQAVAGNRGAAPQRGGGGGGGRGG